MTEAAISCPSIQTRTRMPPQSVYLGAYKPLSSRTEVLMVVAKDFKCLLILDAANPCCINEA